MSAISFSQEIINQANALAHQLEEMEIRFTTREVEQPMDDDESLQLFTAKESYEAMMQALPNINDLARDQIETLQMTLFGIGEKLENLENYHNPLDGRIEDVQFDGQFNFNDEFSELKQTTNAIFLKLVSEGLNCHDAAEQVESTLKDRVLDLASHAQPEQIEQLNKHMTSFENYHFLYFQKQFKDITDGFNDNYEENFYNLLPLYGSLSNFLSNRNFISEKNGKDLNELCGEMIEKLQSLIVSQGIIEAEQESGFNQEEHYESIANKLHLALETIGNSLDPSYIENHASDKEEDSDFDIHSFGEIEELPAISSNSNTKIETASFLETLHLLVSESSNFETENQIQTIINLLEESDAQAINKMFYLQFCLHNKLGKFQLLDDYGRMAFLRSLPEIHQVCNATDEERIEIINRTRILTLLEGIKEAIGSSQTQDLRNLLDQLGSISLNSNMPDGVYGNQNLANKIHGFLYEAHVAAESDGSTRNHPDFGRVALRDEEGFSVSNQIKLAAVARLEEVLNACWKV